MSYYSSRDPYNRYAIIRWWCQNQWWVQIVVPCIVCAGVIGALLYQWNSEQQAQDQKKIFEAQYQYWKDNPPELDPDLEEVKTAWRVIRMKKNDPSMPIPYKKKQLIVKHWKSIIVDMKPEEIQRLHDLLQDKPVKPTDDIEIDIQKFEAPWQDDVSLDEIEPNAEKTASPTDGTPADAAPTENPQDSAKTSPANEQNKADAPASPAPSDITEPVQQTPVPENVTEDNPSVQSESAPVQSESAPVQSPSDSPTESEVKPEIKGNPQPTIESESPPGNDATNDAFQAEPPASQPEKTVDYFPTPTETDDIKPILLDSPEDASVAENETVLIPNDAQAFNEAAPLLDAVADNLEKESKKSAREKRRFSKYAKKSMIATLEEVGPLEDTFLQQREEFIKKALEERNRKIEEFKKNQDPYYFVPSQWKRNPLVL
ncbi:MAG: hypothetical protein IJQ39_02650 [Thermoguttaceae bacterium]|nr:hypothetical protein [Thermoguttaceae bacterium]